MIVLMTGGNYLDGTTHLLTPTMSLQLARKIMHINSIKFTALHPLSVGFFQLKLH